MFYVPVSRRAAPTPRSFDRSYDRSLDRLFDEALDHFFAPAAASDAAPVRRPAIDVAETDAAYVVTLDVPGVSREDVKVSIDGRKVAIVAEARKAEAPSATAADAGTEAVPAERTLLRERAAASFARSLTLAKEIDQAASNARLENGVLTLTLGKRAPTASQLAVD